MPVATLFEILNMIGTFVFGLSGAMVAIRQRFDIFGVLVLAVATGVAGGILRDILLGDAPPEALRNLWPMSVAGLAGVSAFLFAPMIDRLSRPVMVLDAIGLGVFAVAGCRKALIYGLDPSGAVLLGVLSAIGGGVIRDLMATKVPRVLCEDIYALAAFVGATIYAICLWYGVQESYAAAGAIVVAVSLRLLSVRFAWKLPRSPKS